jgi:hypothetical protein
MGLSCSLEPRFVEQGYRDTVSTMVYLKGVRDRDIQARLNKGSLAAFA